VLLEARSDIGGTWDLFRYPGIRSDSDMATMGFGFKPWTGTKMIAEGAEIMRYLREAVDEEDIEPHIRLEHRVTAARWSTEDARWVVEVERTDTGEKIEMSGGFLFMCSGYYSYASGYTPEFQGRQRFNGTIVHPQDWPDELDYSGKRVVVIGSGATAVTLVPAMAGTAAHVTMLQRSPSYLAPRSSRDRFAALARSVLPERAAYALVRKKNAAYQQWIYWQTRRNPERAKRIVLDMVRGEIDDSEIDRHFTPAYYPWDQRICLVPDGDFFQALRSGYASVVTDTIETFTETGIQLDSGAHLEADIIVTATGLQLVTLGDMEFTVDGQRVDFSRVWTYKGVAYSDVPNMASSFGYIAASWTLRADLTCQYVCRLLNHMEATRAVQCTPRLRPEDRSMSPRPFIENFSSGYLQRMLPALPKQGDRAPWLNPQRLAADKKALLKDPVDDGVMQFTVGPAPLRSV
jgi:cation diffusion facilitator CzcD-associated flavoprotein CzcO